MEHASIVTIVDESAWSPPPCEALFFVISPRVTVSFADDERAIPPPLPVAVLFVTVVSTRVKWAPLYPDMAV